MTAYGRHEFFKYNKKEIPYIIKTIHFLNNLPPVNKYRVAITHTHNLVTV